MMVIGRLLYGIGSGTIVTVQVAILSHWFKGKGLAIVVGIQISASRLVRDLRNCIYTSDNLINLFFYSSHHF
jgi:MFS family permease